MKKFILFALLVGCVGCGGEPNWTLEKTTKIDNIEAVFMNRPWDYTVMVRVKDQLVAKTLVGNSHSKVRLFTDAGRGSMWAEVKEYKGGPTRKTDVDIHIHSRDSLQGGQWREGHGKGPEQVGGVHRIE